MLHIQASFGAFAAILEDGSVLTWGNPDGGSDSSFVRDQLRGVQQIQTAGGAFAAILEDGSVVTWGNPHDGGDCSDVKDQLHNVLHIQATGDLPTTSTPLSRACGSSTTMAKCWRGNQAVVFRPSVALQCILLWFCTWRCVQATEIQGY